MSRYGLQPVVMVPAEVYKKMLEVVREVGAGFFVYQPDADSNKDRILKPYEGTDAYKVWETAYNLLPEIGWDDK